MRFLFLLIFLLPISSYSQCYIKGTFKTEKNKPLQYAEVILQNNDSSFIKTSITDSIGNFNFIINDKGTYQLVARYFSKKIFSNDFIIEKDTDLNVIKINSAINLNEITIQTKKPLIVQKVDRLEFNLHNTIAFKNADVFDVLKVIPRIRINHNKISMLGKSKVLLMYNGNLLKMTEESQADFLKSLSTNEVKSIEVISSPPSKYDAEGNIGIVNIKSIKTQKNYWNLNFFPRYIQSTYPEGKLGTLYNFKKNKFSQSLYLNYSKGSFSPEHDEVNYYDDQIWNEKSKERDFTNLIVSRYSFNLKISDPWTIGAQFSYEHNTPNIDKSSRTEILKREESTLDSIIITDNDIHTKNNYSNIDFHSKYKLDSLGKQIEVNFDFFDYNINKNNTLNSLTFFDYDLQNKVDNSYYAQNQIASRYVKNYVGGIDLSLPFSVFKLSFGGKINIINTNYKREYYDLTNGNSVYDQSQSDVFLYDERIIAFYSSLYFKLNEKLEYKVGLRFEDTKTKGFSKTEQQEIINSYTKFFPSIFIFYKIDPNNSFSLNYSKRINRPKFSAVNPFKKYTNQYSYFVGNPYLESEFVQNFELNYINNDNLSLSLFYSYTNNGSSTLTYFNTISNEKISEPLNYFNLHEIGFSGDYTLIPFNNLTSIASLDILWNKMISEKLDIVPNNKGWSGGISLYNNVTITKYIKLNLDLDYTLPGTNIDIKNESTFNTNLGMRFNLMKNKMLIKFEITDLFGTNFQKYSTKNSTMFNNCQEYADEQRLYFQINYRLGNKKIKKTKIDIINKEERSRLN